jgi:hypothetical protein
MLFKTKCPQAFKTETLTPNGVITTMTSYEEDNNALISKIFKMVEEKSEEKVVKKKHTRKPMTPEQKAKAVANLKRGRETHAGHDAVELHKFDVKGAKKTSN